MRNLPCITFLSLAEHQQRVAERVSHVTEKLEAFGTQNGLGGSGTQYRSQSAGR